MSAGRPDPLPGVDGLLAEQLDYYRRRAFEYDEWWQRLGRYDHGADHAAEWERQVGEVEDALEGFAPGGDVLELAGGTGWWTERLAGTASTLTVLDASVETLELNRRRLGPRAGLRYVVADLFDWEPDRRYDTVFFSFWLSHVPRRRFAPFWELVWRCLSPQGRVFLIDNRRGLEELLVEHHIVEEADGVQRRTLNDGSAHRVVKVYWEPAELTARLGLEGWEAEIGGTRWFIYGSARPAAHARR
jgi:demethylmenaquinone methyltransferase/2-methoxy-6-polyprenyl-1,4-benzoquinol methylase